ncbi:response regulator transcription factor [Amycolatopsis saalfeldensis]|uniref:DNA-binding response regulator, OmpR family, contains REC and winged-helix (WHTH) domain n=1 Tax=Amycolatopsis saalfeldensis TaxID=394193 RepID=A0A1H8Y9K8_9PSEU|nr:response regulator transcription factor [Amycolatopsis saalfeldensis]SEP48964.1 DNA-binding response regulator, OmpR family, contains REC and winged-helix (wHTH) domain [Amycolatopsis saalfeldensis]
MCAFVLVAEDDVKQAELLRRYLRSEEHSVLVVHDGREAVEQAALRHPDLLVLDVMMPGQDGLEVMRALRRDSDVPVLLVTARSTAEDKLAGFDLGADDYVTKPYDPRELMARVRSLLRRAEPSGRRPVLPLRVGELVLDQIRHAVRLRDRPIDCTPAEFRILEALMAEPGRVLSRRQLLNQAHGQDTFVTERTADAHLKNLRRKIEADPRRPEYLHTVYGVGYKIAHDG